MSALPEQVTQEAAAPRLPAYRNRGAIFALFKSLGIIRLELNFDGCGKNADVEVEKIEGLIEDPRKIPIDGVERAISRLGGPDAIVLEKIINMYGIKAQTLDQYFDNLVEDIFKDTEWDWVWRREEGSWGTIVIVPMRQEVFVNINVREMISTHYQRTL